MSNRQARREQSRAKRAQRARSDGGRRPSPGGGRRPGGSSWITQPFTLIAAGLVVGLAFVLGFVLATGGDDGGRDAFAVASLEAARAALPVELVDGNKLGSEDAPVKLSVFEDFQCPYCLRFTANQEPVLVEEYVKAGKLQIIFEQLPVLGLESLFAANASICAADQNKFWEFHSELFLAQARAGQLEDEEINIGRFDAGQLKELGAQVGMPDQEAFDLCVDRGDHDADVQESLDRARSLGFQGTPSFMMNGLPLLDGAGALSDIQQWRDVIDNEIVRIEGPADETPTDAPDDSDAGESPTAESPATEVPTQAADATEAP